VFAPSLLIMVDGFTWTEFATAFVGCVLGITVLAAALSNYMFTKMRMWERLVCVFAALLMIAPGLLSTSIGIAIVIPIVVRHYMASRRKAAAA
jgi:TRAP-type uncharacterized transport system fused permease subunit